MRIASTHAFARNQTRAHYERRTVYDTIKNRYTAKNRACSSVVERVTDPPALTLPLWATSSVVEHFTDNEEAVGSIPTSPKVKAKSGAVMTRSEVRSLARAIL